jgi:hypothetical protein
MSTEQTNNTPMDTPPELASVEAALAALGEMERGLAGARLESKAMEAIRATLASGDLEPRLSELASSERQAAGVTFEDRVFVATRATILAAADGPGAPIADVTVEPPAVLTHAGGARARETGEHRRGRGRRVLRAAAAVLLCVCAGIVVLVAGREQTREVDSKSLAIEVDADLDVLLAAIDEQIDLALMSTSQDAVDVLDALDDEEPL